MYSQIVLVALSVYPPGVNKIVIVIVIVIITTAFGLRCGSEGAFWGSGVPQQISRAKRATPHVRGLSLQVEGQGPLAYVPNPTESRA